MAIWTYGSINIDHLYTLPHMPAPGETLAATGYQRGLGGKGANQSVAAARAGAEVTHLGAVGPDGDWAAQELARAGVDCTHLHHSQTPTGHAIILVDPQGENQIILSPGANAKLTADQIRTALDAARPGDLLLLQNEVTDSLGAARLAKARGLRVMTSAAPFDAEALRPLLPLTDILALNAVEAAQLAASLGQMPALPEILITRGAEGAELHLPDRRLTEPALPVTPLDTTGAGDTFAGYYAASRDQNLPPEQALARASAAAALKVTRAGTATAIPTAAELDRFLAARA